MLPTTRTIRRTPVPDIIKVTSDRHLLGSWFSGPSWAVWRSVLKAAYALPMSDSERVQFRSVADRDPPAKQVRELWIVAGRRAGKDSIASAIAVHAAIASDTYAPRLRPGERASVLCLACDRDQAQIVLKLHPRLLFQGAAAARADYSRAREWPRPG